MKLMACLTCADGRKKAFNLPQLHLPRDQQLVADLRAAATKEDLQAYIKEWRREGLPAKLTLQQQPASGTAEAPQAGAAAIQGGRAGRRTPSSRCRPAQQHPPCRGSRSSSSSRSSRASKLPPGPPPATPPSSKAATPSSSRAALHTLLGLPLPHCWLSSPMAEARHMQLAAWQALRA